jgi:poly-gamma-glutamate synthesis protein (capsule biosynthesis protein)
MKLLRIGLFVLLMLVLAACSATLPVFDGTPPTQDTPAATTEAPATAVPEATETPQPTATPEPTATPTPTPQPLTVSMAADLPQSFATALGERLAAAGPLPDGRVIKLVDAGQDAEASILLRPAQSDDVAVLAERVFVVVAPFATLQDEIALDTLRKRWAGDGQPLFMTDEAAALLTPVLGEDHAQIVSTDGLLAELKATPGALGVLPFDQLNPTYKVLNLDGFNPVDNRFSADGYPLAVQVVVQGEASDDVADVLAGAIEPMTNRDPDKLTTLVMTGVTAMARVTAKRMEQKGYTYPAKVIGPELSAADITHISNEIPFIEGCKVNASADNLKFCSKPEYWAALEAVGTDIVGLSGNHVNDFGRKGAQQSLAFYKDNGIPVYGSGLNEEEACKPLLLEDHGNTFAFIAALAYQPARAWATKTEPGACYYYKNKEKILNMIQDLSQQVDIVAVELQFYETYKPYPTKKQVREFRELRDAGADIVTGVQSHVPQALEPYGDSDAGGAGIIAYGLGNFFFDQMWSQETRDELYLRHTIYDGKLIHTEILTGVLYDYAQPRWATPKQRARILNRIFKAAPAR